MSDKQQERIKHESLPEFLATEIATKVLNHVVGTSDIEEAKRRMAVVEEYDQSYPHFEGRDERALRTNDPSPNGTTSMHWNNENGRNRVISYPDGDGYILKFQTRESITEEWETTREEHADSRPEVALT